VIVKMQMPKTLLVPEKIGYTFAGWYNNPEFTGTATTQFPGYVTATSVTAITYYAKWTVNTPESTEYSLYLNFNGGSEIYYPNSFTENDEIELPTTSTKTGYMFVGWYESSDLSGLPVEKIQLGTTLNKTFYAKWKKDLSSNIASSYIYTGYSSVNNQF